jgi:hypothetical protein
MQDYGGIVALELTSMQNNCRMESWGAVRTAWTVDRGNLGGLYTRRGLKSPSWKKSWVKAKPVGSHVENALGLQYEPLPYFKIFWLCLKTLRFLKIHIYYIQYIEILSFAPHYYDGGMPQISVKSLWQTADLPEKNRFVNFYLPLLWGSRTEMKNCRTYCPCGYRRPNFPPVRAAFLSLWPAAEPIFPGPGAECLWFYFEKVKDKLVPAFKGTSRTFSKVSVHL